MCGERGRRRFTIGPGDGDDLRARALGAMLAAEQFGVADDLHACRLGLFNRPMRFGMGQRHAGCKHERGEFAPVGGVQIDEREAARRRRHAPFFAIIPENRRRAACLERLGGRQPRQAKPEDGDFSASEDRDGDHGRFLLC